MFGKEPPLLVKICETRWLAWYGAVTTHHSQYSPLRRHFNLIAESKEKTCPIAKQLAEMHNDNCNFLYLTFLRQVLREITSVNLIFQSTYADITKAYKDLRTLVFSMGDRVIRNEVLKRPLNSSVLRTDELEALSQAIREKDNLKPLDFVGFGENFRKLSTELRTELTEMQINTVKSNCANFFIRMVKELIERLPCCISSIENLRYFSPQMVLAKRGRPSFNLLPFEVFRKNNVFFA